MISIGCDLVHEIVDSTSEDGRIGGVVDVMEIIEVIVGRMREEGVVGVAEKAEVEADGGGEAGGAVGGEGGSGAVETGGAVGGGGVWTALG